MSDWISVKDRLPEKYGWYKVKTENGHQTEAPYVRQLNSAPIFLMPNSDKVTHWKTI